MNEPAPTSLRHIVVTGAGGYIGAHLVELAVSRGIRVTVLGRTASASCLVRRFPWRLPDNPPAEAFSQSEGWPLADAVLHLAHVWSGAGEIDSDPNVIGSNRLFSEAARQGVPRIVFASSVSSRPDALNRYGRLKATLESTAPTIVLSARIGLVYGGSPRSQWGTLLRLVRRFPMLPVPGSGKPVQPIHLDEVCEGLLRMAALGSPTRRSYGLASPQPMTFGCFLETISREAAGHSFIVLPVPVELILAGMTVATRLPFLRRIDRERILGIAGIRALPVAKGLDGLGIEVAPLEAGLRADPAIARRRLIVEAATIGSYLFRHRPSLGFLKRYAAAVGQHSDRLPVPMPVGVVAFPGLLRLFDAEEGEAGGYKGIAGRLRLGLRLMEASPDGTAALFDYRGRGPLRAMIALAGTAIVEGLLLPLRRILKRTPQ
jgi:nucleoside-diphosphate-sugar epimerase